MRKIITLSQSITAADAHTKLALPGERIIKPLSLINAIVVNTTSVSTLETLLEKPGVLSIEDDIIIDAISTGKPKVPRQPAQKIPWGIDRIDAERCWEKVDGKNINVAVLDTGIDLKHPDLVVDGGVNTINKRSSYNDDNGHGTHVAGIIGALSNKIGVIGAAPAVYLFAVKALNKKGEGYLSDIIEGLQWCISNDIDLINMSLGTPSESNAMKQAVEAVYNAGITIVAAAGNSGPDNNTVLYPGKYPQVIAVSAIDQEDKIAYFSSVGPEVDLAAPGVNIFSTYKRSTYQTLSGTSMAAPHVTGAAALVLAAHGSMTPDQLREFLKSKADDLGLPSNQQGAGLIDAFKAISST